MNPSKFSSFGLAAAFLAVSVAGALEVTPSAVALRGAPGRKLSGEILVRNDSDRVVRVGLEASSPSETVVREGGGPVPNKKEKPWLHFPVKPFDLAPGAERRIRLRVKVPRGEGERSATLTARGSAGDQNTEYRILRRVSVRIAGTERPAAVLEEVRLIPLPDGGRGLSALFRNTGNISLRPRFGTQSVAGEASVLPGTEDLVEPGRALPVHWDLPAAADPAAAPKSLTAFFQDADGRTLSAIAAVGSVDLRAP